MCRKNVAVGIGAPPLYTTTSVTWTLHVIFLIRDGMAVLAAFLLVTVTDWNSTNYLLHSLLRSGVWCGNTSWWQHQPTRPSQSTGTLKWVLPAQWRSLWFVYHNKSDYYFVELASIFSLQGIVPRQWMFIFFVTLSGKSKIWDHCGLIRASLFNGEIGKLFHGTWDMSEQV